MAIHDPHIIFFLKFTKHFIISFKIYASINAYI